MSTDDVEPASETRRSRRGFLLWGAVAALVIFAAVWTVFWFGASREASARIDSWLEKEAAFGRLWSCPARRIEGFPLKLRAVCDDPAFWGALDGVPIEARLSRLSVATSFLTPSRADAELGGPLIIEMQDASALFSLTFARLRLDLRLAGEKLQRLTATGAGLEAHWNAPDGAAIDGAIATFELSVQPAQASGDDVYGVELASAGLVFPTLDRFAGSSDPATLTASARVTGAASIFEESGSMRSLERWRAGRGQLQLQSLVFGKGALEFTASGEFALDDAHRLDGRSEVSIKGADRILLRLGVAPRALGLAHAFNHLLREPNPNADQPAMKLPLSFKDGKAAIGPLRNMFALKPLY